MLELESPSEKLRQALTLLKKEHRWSSQLVTVKKRVLHFSKLVIWGSSWGSGVPISPVEGAGALTAAAQDLHADRGQGATDGIGHPRLQPQRPQTFSKLMFLLYFSESYIFLSWLSGALVGIGGSDFIAYFYYTIRYELVCN